VIEGSILAYDHNNMLNGCFRPPALVIRACRDGEQPAEAELKQYDRN
jgi:hypothetical protein